LNEGDTRSVSANGVGERAHRPAIEKTRLKEPIAASYPLVRAAAVHEQLVNGHVLGKIVLRVQN
jgi:NADPH:quinone reductase-like Zn-dependent oxidoreductase